MLASTEYPEAVQQEAYDRKVNATVQVRGTLNNCKENHKKNNKNDILSKNWKLKIRYNTKHEYYQKRLWS